MTLVSSNYSTRHAKKNMIFLTTNSKPLYIYVYESQQQKAHTHKHQHQHQVCGKNNPLSLSKLYNTPCIYTDPLLFFVHTYISITRHKFIYTHSSSIHPSIHHKHPHKHTKHI